MKSNEEPRRATCASEGCDRVAGVKSPFCHLCRRVLDFWRHRSEAARVHRAKQLTLWQNRMEYVAAKKTSAKVVDIRSRRRA
jgi:hypothetical protein